MWCMADILKKFNPNVKGFATGKGKANSKGAGLSVAVSGAIARDMPAQADELVRRLKSRADIDYANDWKFVTLWIGGNDLCSICENKPENRPEMYAAYIEQALDKLLEVPRMFVSLVSIIDVTRLGEVRDGMCPLLHKFLCPCAVHKDAAVRDGVSKSADVYQDLTYLLAEKPKYHTRDDWTVVVQPFFVEADVPRKPDGKPDRSYFSPDCFHFAVKSHGAAAIGLFNGVLEPVGEKRNRWYPDEPIACPTKEFPYLATAKNSAVLQQLRMPAQHTSESQDTGAAASNLVVPLAVVGAVVGVAVLGAAGVALHRLRRRVATRREYDAIQNRS